MHKIISSLEGKNASIVTAGDCSRKSRLPMDPIDKINFAQLILSFYELYNINPDKEMYGPI